MASPGAWSERRGLPVVLLAALAQGLLLYLLQRAASGERFPATEPAWMLALVAATLVVPLGAQLLAEHAARRVMWLLLGAVGAAFFAFGFWHGAWMAGEGNDRYHSAFALLVQLVLLADLLLPFVQVRIESGRWRPGYERLFALAWRNHLVLAEAAVFTGIFWLLLLLWQVLFGMLGIELFADVFSSPLFVCIVTPLVFALALHLIGALEHLSALVLAQVLGVLNLSGDADEEFVALSGQVAEVFTQREGQWHHLVRMDTYGASAQALPMPWCNSPPWETLRAAVASGSTRAESSPVRNLRAGEYLFGPDTDPQRTDAGTSP